MVLCPGGDIHEWSDIDLLIVKKTTKRPLDRILEVSRIIKPTVGIDLFVYTPDEFHALMQEKFSFLTAIARTGKVLFMKREDAERVLQSARKMREWMRKIFAD